MKNLIILFSIICFASNANANDEKIVKSKIAKVTVYSQGAQVYRKASYSVTKGITEIVIDGVSNNIDNNSLQVNATGNVIILDTKYAIHYPEVKTPKLEGLSLKTRRKILALEDSIYNINYVVRAIQDEIDVYQATKNILKNNGAIRGQGKVNDSIGLLKDAIDYYTKKMMEVNKKLLKLNREKIEVNKTKSGMQNRLNLLKNAEANSGIDKPKGPTYRITITLKANASANGKVDVSYLVNNAGWTPLYDLRSETSSNKINLNYKANVHQNTGVDWDDVRLNISTNNPYQNKTKPELHPWYIDFHRYRNQLDNLNKMNLGNKDKMRREAKSRGYVSNSAPARAEYDSDVEEVIVAEKAYDFTTTVENMISAEFQIDLPYSIKSNGQKHMVLVKNVDLDANYKYYTVPKYDKSVYLVAQLSKLAELQLVPAKANIFFDGTYMGETYLDPTTMDDTLNLSLGKDPNIIVKRTLLKKESKEKIVGQKKERTFSYSIEVKNLKSRNIKLVVQDQIPITQNADIEIETLGLGKGKLNKRTGLIEWEFNLKPKASKDLQFSYKVKHDKDKMVYFY
ncbi:MAG: DUF4139 domain-containing protein [Fluviicola sp.]|nr:DUF4139 domain-containing protein [Fluviicola sp.]